VRQAEELCACVGCRATPGFAGLTREFGWPTTGPSRLIGQTGFQGDNYYRPVTFSAPSLGNVPCQTTGACLGQPWPPDQGPVGLKAGGVARADRWPAIGQLGPKTSGCQGTGPRLDPRQPRVGASLGFFSLWSPERPPYRRSRGSARKISLAGELRPLSCYAFAKRWLLPSPLGGETLERTALCSLSSS